VISCSTLLAPLRYNCGWMTGFKYLDTLVPVLVVVSVMAAPLLVDYCSGSAIGLGDASPICTLVRARQSSFLGGAW
jgi:hypothetical protein